MPAKKPHLDIDLIRSAAATRWPEIIAHICGFDRELLDGNHHPCPKCGGHDRFRLIDPAAGSLLCNQCFREKNGDGFAAIQWACNLDFITAAAKIGEYLNIEPSTNGHHHGRHKAKADPAEHLQFLEWNEAHQQLVALWCGLWKQPITPAGLLAAHARIAMYRQDHKVIAIPVWGEKLNSNGANPVGWCLYSITGGSLPKWSKGKDGKPATEWVKIKLTRGSQPGLMGPVERLAADSTTANTTPPTTIWKLEGPSDMLAMLSLADLPPDVIPITNANGAGEKPANWMLELFRDKQSLICHDADVPGQNGAIGYTDRQQKFRPGWAQQIATTATRVSNVHLPFPVSETHGNDLRDFLNLGKTYLDLLTLIDPEQTIKAVAGATQVSEADDDPHRLARINLQNYAASRGGRTLRYWRDEWYVWRETHYRKITEKELRAKIAQSCKEEFDRINIERLEAHKNSHSDDTPPLCRKVTHALASNVLLATAGMTVLSSAVDPMTWLPTRERKKYLAMRNGILDIEALLAGAEEEDCIQRHSPDWFSTVCLPYDFDIAATCPTWEAFLERNLEADAERIHLLQEWAGYLLLPDTGYQRFLVLEGEGANGKSVYCAAIEAMLGIANVSHVPLEVFGEKFELTSTLDRLCNICGDAGEIDKVAEGHLKAFTAGNPMSFGRKYLEPVERVPTARLMLAVNNRPRFSDRSDGIWRRMLLVPWRIQIPVGQRTPNMDKPWWWEQSGELPGILLWAIKGLARLTANGQFTTSVLCEEALGDYRTEMNPARRFLQDNVAEKMGGRLQCSQMYKHYVTWSRENGHHPLAEQQFGREVSRSFRNCKRHRTGNGKDRYYFYEHISYSVEQIGNESVEDGELFS